MDNKFICFICGTEFQYLISFILSCTIYQKKKKLLILDAGTRLAKYKAAISSSKLWDEKIFIEFLKSPEIQLKELSVFIKNISTVHFFTFGYPLFNQFLIECEKKDIKIILTDEGIGTYQPYKRWPSILKLDEKDMLDFETGLNGIEEIWLLNPNLYADRMDKPIFQIPVDKFVTVISNNCLLKKEFNHTFSLEGDMLPQCDIVYFRQYNSLIGNISEQMDIFFDRMVINLLENKDYAIKDHPAFISNPYIKDVGKKVGNQPWETIVLYNLLNKDKAYRFPKVYLSINSSSSINSCSLGIEGTYIFLNKIFEKYSNTSDHFFNYLLDKCSTLYKNSTFYCPDDWDDLINVINNLTFISAPMISPNKIKEVEIEWLRENLQIQWNNHKLADEKIRDLQMRLALINHELEVTKANLSKVEGELNSKWNSKS